MERLQFGLFAFTLLAFSFFDSINKPHADSTSAKQKNTGIVKVVGKHRVVSKI